MVTKYTEAELLEMTPHEYRSMVRKGEWTESTRDVCPGYAATDIVIISKEYAYDFLVFCHRNPLACPVVDITEVGSPHPPLLAPDADLRTDLPRYRVYKDGQVVDEPTDITKYWRDDLVAFLLGEAASSLYRAWKAANIPFQSKGTFTTNIPLTPVGPFHGNVAASCRLFENSHDAIRAIQIASRHPLFHGPPIHIGDPSAIGIKDLSQPDVIRPAGQIPPMQPTDGIAMFWPCFGTVRGVAVEAKLPLMIVDYPLHNFVSDKLAEELALL